MKIQGMKESSGRYSHFDPERELAIFEQLREEMKGLTIKELLGFSLIMEDQAMAMAPGSYPVWSNGVHLVEAARGPSAMINPILLKINHPDLFNLLSFNSDFTFLKQF